MAGDLLARPTRSMPGSVVLVLDVPPDEAPWLAINPAGEWAGEQLRLRKRPLLWCYRPLAWPVWNHQHRRLARYWSAGAGLDDTVIDALRTRRLDRLDVVKPTADELARQLQAELPVSRGHLRTVVERYWDRDWRRSTRATTSLPRTTCGERPQPSPRCMTPSTSSRPDRTPPTGPYDDRRRRRRVKHAARDGRPFASDAHRPSKIDTGRLTRLASRVTTFVVRVFRPHVAGSQSRQTLASGIAAAHDPGRTGDRCEEPWGERAGLRPRDELSAPRHDPGFSSPRRRHHGPPGARLPMLVTARTGRYSCRLAADSRGRPVDCCWQTTCEPW